MLDFRVVMLLLTLFRIRSAEWLGDVLIYTNNTNRLNYLVGDQTYTVSHFDKPMYILGYLQRDNRIYITDKDLNVTSFALSLPVLEYQTLVLREDMETAAELLPQIPQDQLNKIARFLEGQGHKELALEVATDPEHKFDLALGLNQLHVALELAREADSDHKWKTLGDAGLAAWDVPLATECFLKARDMGSLLLVFSSTGDRNGLNKLAEKAEAAGAHNVAFTCKWQVGDVEGCVDILRRTGRLAEAVLFAQTYKPSLAPALVAEWKESLEKQKKGRVAKAIGVPPNGEGEGDEDLFPEWNEWLRLEKDGPAEQMLVDVSEEKAASESEEEEESAEESSEKDE